MKTSLVIMAAGIGSRFGGGIKQLQPVGPQGEIIMDYSVHDAIEAGFTDIIFVIRKDIEKDFREIIGDRISAAWYGVAPTGNGRRESFRYAPIPRMRATYMEAGGEDPRAIVERVKEGIFVDQFSNGQVKIGEGDFTFFVKSGWLIENGRLTMPVKDINIIGNGPQALSDIVAVGSDLKIDEGAWTCGKEQSCPVSCGIPTVLVSRLTVGGVEG